MRKSGVDADEVTLVNLLQICKVLGDLRQCKLVHSRVFQGGFQSNDLVMNSLIDAYAKCNQINLAWRVFCQMKRPDIVTWSTVISGFTHCGMPDEIALYRDMRLSLENSNPNPVTLLSLLEACALSAELGRSKWAHGIAIRMGLASDVVVALYTCMYSKCGAIHASRKAFDQIFAKNIISWSAIITAYGLNGLPHDALALLYEMEVHGLKPNPVTILSVLSACCHGGLVEEGLSVIKGLANKHGTELKLEHYSCLVDLLARAGNLDDALELIKSIPVGMKPGASAWGALLSACRNYENGKLTAGALSQILELEPSNSAGYLIASNMYATGGSWMDASRMRCLMKERGIKVVAGYSLVHGEEERRLEVVEMEREAHSITNGEGLEFGTTSDIACLFKMAALSYLNSTSSRLNSHDKALFFNVELLKAVLPGNLVRRVTHIPISSEIKDEAFQEFLLQEISIF
ncbi:UNVERIFIED_CONTAM: Pentatricopeptide repeat-containing protein [Sesamum calycinum]|uniref:Pentatricopeptide repeat-containing protein n=1 Tax=Sesamum calycinum TaxID=2727403 RepID=A0AAW2RRY4_9LAMI